MAEELTRKELSEIVAKQALELEAMKQQVAVAPPGAGPDLDLTARMRREIETANAEIARLRAPGESTILKGPPPQLIPYKGAVRATEVCHVGQRYEAGAVFLVDVPALWNDDPFVPVIVLGYSELGTPLTEPNALAPPRIDHRFRQRVSNTDDLVLRRQG